MSEAESPVRRATVDDVRALLGAATPHFALQVRNRIARLIADLPEGDPARVLGEREIARLTHLGFDGETRGAKAPAGVDTLPSVGALTAAGQPADEPEDHGH